MVTHKSSMSIFSLISFAISIIGAVLYGMVFKFNSVLIIWIITSIISVILPIIAKIIRLKRQQSGKIFEILAIVVGGFNFYCVIFVLTKLPIFVAYLGWICCGFLYKSIKDINNAISHEETPNIASFETSACSVVEDATTYDTLETKIQKKSVFPLYSITCLIIFNIILICIICVSLYTNYQLQGKINKLVSEISELQIDSENIHEKILNVEDVLNNIGASGLTTINGETYLEYRINRIEKRLNLGSGEQLNVNGETLEEWRARTKQD